MKTFNISYTINGNKRNAENIGAVSFNDAAQATRDYFASKGFAIKDIKFEGEFNGQCRVK